MTASRTLYAALVLPDADDLSLKPGLDAAAAALAVHDARADGAPLRSPRKLSVCGGTLSLRVTVDETGDGGPRLLFEIFGPDSAPIGQGPDKPRDRVAVVVLADAVAAVLRASDAEAVEWCAPGALIAREEFLSLHEYVSPRRKGRSNVPMLGHGGAEGDAGGASNSGQVGRMLARQFRATSPLEARLRAAGWAMTALLATLSLPVAAVVSVVGLRRGMDFRLTAQALVGTLLVTALLESWPGLGLASSLLN